jgi:hypothetical protein
MWKKIKMAILYGTVLQFVKNYVLRREVVFEGEAKKHIYRLD